MEPIEPGIIASFRQQQHTDLREHWNCQHVGCWPRNGYRFLHAAHLQRGHQPVLADLSPGSIQLRCSEHQHYSSESYGLCDHDRLRYNQRYVHANIGSGGQRFLDLALYHRTTGCAAEYAELFSFR